MAIFLPYPIWTPHISNHKFISIPAYSIIKYIINIYFTIQKYNKFVQLINTEFNQRLSYR